MRSEKSEALLRPASIDTEVGLCCVWVSCTPSLALEKNSLLSDLIPGLDATGVRYCDGHVEWVRGTETVETRDRRTKRKKEVAPGQGSFWNAVA